MTAAEAGLINMPIDLLSGTAFIHCARKIDLREKVAFSQESFTVACVSSPLRLSVGDKIFGATERSSDTHLNRVFKDDYTHFVNSEDGFTKSEWIEQKENEISKALEQDPDVILFGEFSLPYDKNTRDQILENMKRALRPRSKKTFVVAGSYHCSKNSTNTAEIISPLIGNDDPQHFDVGIEVDLARNDFETKPSQFNGASFQIPEGSHDNHISYDKKLPARRAGEELVVGKGTAINLYETNFGTLAVLICSDVIDYNQSLFLAARNIRSLKPIDLILVASYNRSAVFAAFCRSLSLMTSTPIIVTNANPHSHDFENSTAYLGGLEYSQLSDLTDLSDVIKLKFKADVNGPSTRPGKEHFSSLTIFELNIKKLKASRDILRNLNPLKNFGSRLKTLNK